MEVVKALGERLIARKDVKAIQGPDGSWYPVRTNMKEKSSALVPFTMQDFKDHLAGTKTFGHYMVSPEGMCKYFAYDIDLRKINPKDGYEPDFDPRDLWKTDDSELGPEQMDFKRKCRGQLLHMGIGLARISARRLEEHCQGIAISDSGGKGVHVYVFLGLIPADVAKTAALEILQGNGAFTCVRGENFWRHDMSYEDIEIEVFPKQRDMGDKEFGNLMKLPLGVHRPTGRRSFFIDITQSDDLHFAERLPLEALSGSMPWE